MRLLSIIWAICLLTTMHTKTTYTMDPVRQARAIETALRQEIELLLPHSSSENYLTCIIQLQEHGLTVKKMIEFMFRQDRRAALYAFCQEQQLPASTVPYLDKLYRQARNTQTPSNLTFSFYIPDDIPNRQTLLAAATSPSFTALLNEFAHLSIGGQQKLTIIIGNPYPGTDKEGDLAVTLEPKEAITSAAEIASFGPQKGSYELHLPTDFFDKLHTYDMQKAMLLHEFAHMHLLHSFPKHLLLCYCIALSIIKTTSNVLPTLEEYVMFPQQDPEKWAQFKKILDPGIALHPVAVALKVTPAWCALNQVDEYEADVWLSLTDIHLVYACETLVRCTMLGRDINSFFADHNDRCETHPSASKRLGRLVKIRQLLQAEEAWLASATT